MTGTWIVEIAAPNALSAIGKAQALWEGDDTSLPVELVLDNFEPADSWAESDVEITAFPKEIEPAGVEPEDIGR